LPIFFPAGAVAFRVFRVIRIFRLFQINAQYDAFNVITNVLKEKKNQIISSVCMVAIPTGIFSAGFVEQYTKLKMLAYHSEEHELKFVTSVLTEDHVYNGKMVREIVFPAGN